MCTWVTRRLYPFHLLFCYVLLYCCSVMLLFSCALPCLWCLQLFACGGRLIFGPDIRSLCLSFLLILVPGTLFCVLVAPNFRGRLPGGVAVLPATIVFVVWVGALRITNQADDKLFLAEYSRKKKNWWRLAITFYYFLFNFFALQLLISWSQSFAIDQMVHDKRAEKQ